MTETEQAERLVHSDEPLSAGERELFDTITCDGGCGRDVWKKATVDVVAGQKMGEWNEPEYHVGMAGIDAKSPEHQWYCLDCATAAGFDITKPAGERSIDEVNAYLTPSNIASLLTGVFLVMLVVLLF